MTRLWIYIISLFSLAYSSTLELYGTGERLHEVQGMEIGLGDSYFFSDYVSGYNATSIATLWRTDLTRLTFSSNFTANINGAANKDINMSFFSFSFPVFKDKTIGFGLTPYTRSNIKLLEEGGTSIGQGASDFIDQPLSSRSEYRFYGGISNLYLAFSTKVNKSNSFGFKLNNLFGNQIHINKIIVSTLEASFDDEVADYSLIEQDSTSKIILNRFSGFSLQLDWNSSFNNHQIGMSVTMMGPIDISLKKYYDIYSISDPMERYFLMDYSYLYLESGDDLITYDPDYTNSINDNIDAKSFIPNLFNRVNDYKFGYQFNGKDAGVMLEFHGSDMFDNYSLEQDDVSVLNNPQPSSNSYHIGLYKRYDNFSKKFFNSINLRAGGYYRDYNFNNGEGSDVAISFGIGIGINNYSNLIDLGFKMGRINTPSFESEDYIKGSLSINIGEKWFSRSRRK